MPSAIIVGSGSSAAAAALALTTNRQWRVTVVDAGAHLPEANAAAVARMSVTDPARWQADDRQLVATSPVAAPGGALPEKRTHGSSHPFDDVGQLEGVAVSGGAHQRLISGGYGGFSAVWGAQFTPFPAAALAAWPLAPGALGPHYAAIQRHVPVAAVDDDLAEALPLDQPALVPPPLSARAEAVLAGYGADRERLRAAGLLLGRSRMAMRAGGCVLCGLCNSGCPYSLIWSASQTFDSLRGNSMVEYRDGLLVTHVEERDGAARVAARNLRSGSVEVLEADRVFLACGAVGSTRLVMSSLDRHDEAVTIRESAQFVVPFLSRRSTGDPRRQQDHALGQLSALLGDAHAADVAHLQLYTYDPSFLGALPAVPGLRGERARGALLGRLSVGLVYLPSSTSPGLDLRLGAPAGAGRLPELSVVPQGAGQPTSSAMRRAIRVLLRAAPALDLWPVLPRVELSAPGRSYHWGGSLPHRAGEAPWPGTDTLGRPRPWRRIHVVDAAVMPSIASTSFTFTTMANAHRITTEAMRVEASA